MKQDTICALATPPGGAIAVVRVSGPDAVAITGSIFSKPLEKAEGYSLHFGEIKDMDGNEFVLDNGEKISISRSLVKSAKNTFGEYIFGRGDLH